MYDSKCIPFRANNLTITIINKRFEDSIIRSKITVFLHYNKPIISNAHYNDPV